MSAVRPRVLVTGATGFVGGTLVPRLLPRFDVAALGRRAPAEAGLPEGPGVEWYRADIGRLDELAPIFDAIRTRGRVDFVIHLAAYYDLTLEERPEYEATNVTGTRNVLALAETLAPRLFVFTSSVAACAFPPPGGAITEESPADGDGPYARSKRAGEELVRDARDRLPVCVVRPAAVFSDWCEFPALDALLSAWCAGGLRGRCLGGRGVSAVPYVHVEDLAALYVRLLERPEALAPGEVVLASPDGATSHRALFHEATRAAFGAPRRPLLVPRPLSRAGIGLLRAGGRLTGTPVLERPWMADYIDRSLTVRAARSRERTGWSPDPSRSVLATFPAMVANLRAHPDEWRRRRALRGKWPESAR